MIEERLPISVLAYIQTPPAQFRAAERHSPGVALNRARKLLLKCDRL
jgi:hypothetical protein